MKYSQKTDTYRAALMESLTKGERDHAKIRAIALANALKAEANSGKEYLNGAKMLNQARICECIAVMLEQEGITEQVIRIATNMENLSTSCIPQAPVAPPLKKQPATKAVEPQPNEVVSKVSAGETDWVADVFEKNLPATVVVCTQTGSGTGFFISGNGYLLTNHHVVEAQGKIYDSVRIDSGDNSISCRATVIAYNKDKDVALLKAETGTKTPYIPFIENYSSLRQGESVVLIGNGLSYGLAPIVGTVKFLHEKDDKDLVYTAPSNNGDSGGPVLNKHGECVGINKSRTKSVTRGCKTYEAQGITNATAADELKKLVAEWQEKYNINF